MAMRSGNLVQDENHRIHFNGSSVGGKANALNSQNKSGLRSRKPLGDLSNSGKPVLNLPSKWQTPKRLNFIEEETGAGREKNILKKAQTGTRKALYDISNSRKPGLHEVPKKKQNLNQSDASRKEPLRLNAILEEGFLHNHGECIKAQNCPLDMDQFLRIIGLDGPREIISSKLNNPLEQLVELEEMVESPVIDRSPKRIHLRERFESSPPCKSPKSPSPLWNHSHNVNFTLMKTP